MDLRPYQQRAVANILAARAAGSRRILVVAPTGSGKTVIAAHMIEAWHARGKRILVVAHRKELLDQFDVHLRGRGITPGLMRAEDERADPNCPVQLASIATLVRRELPEADVVFVDESHRVPGDSYGRTLAAYPAATVLGLTATPCRLDGKPLREFFDTIIEVARYSELIESGAILAPVVYAPRRGVDLSGVRRVAGEYHEGQLETAMRRPHVIGDVVAEWKEHARGRSTVVFAVGIAHSRELCAAFQAEGVAAVHIDGGTSEMDRALALLDLEAGKTQVLCNVGVLCEGWDQPRVKCCVMARPTLSLTLHMQCVGRILRPWGEQCPVVLDHAGNTERHGLPHEDREWSLETGVAKRVGPPLGHVCGGCYGYVLRSPCELCGYAATVTAREVRTQAGKLAAVEPSGDPRRAYFDKELARAQNSGFKPGFAGAKYKEKFGEWPPWSWSEAAKAAYALDATWREDVRRRTAERERWQALKAPMAELAAAVNDVEPQFSRIDEL
jgi:DNA repair protein RadD